MSVGESYLTVQGNVGGEVQFKDVNDTIALASFRLASTPRQFDRGKGSWIDRPTTWFTVECWRTLAKNVAVSVERGHPVIVTGRLKTTEWTEEGETRSRTVLEAFSVGHDLSRGTTAFTKNPPQAIGGTGNLDEQMRDLTTRAESPTDKPEEEEYAPSRQAA
ncbi:single-strand DNA-binding protein [Kribbella amoyensis]|uniref:Single-stranded DNA-binding protein n=1 Tax=Kribbella amoyensis TaxID=996641 RepID=A0A561BV19_9ACTN|nr:single-stranded DNA-binding protein [Kribbella amoyensis]TWD82687.1 single-strand DNA-binding protein [Kribbella amoyensis]